MSVNTRWQCYYLMYVLCLPTHYWSEAQNARAGGDSRSHLQHCPKPIPWNTTFCDAIGITRGGAGGGSVATSLGHTTSQKCWIPVGLNQWVVWVGGVGSGIYSLLPPCRGGLRLSAAVLWRPQFLVRWPSPYTYSPQLLFWNMVVGTTGFSCPFMSKGGNSTLLFCLS